MKQRLWVALAAMLAPCPLVAHAQATDVAARGAYVAREADCQACHTAKDGAPFAGGYPIASPLGVIYSTNITPSKKNGIGGWTEAQFAAAVREGVSADGHHLYPAMPYDAYSGMTDKDIHALYVFLNSQVAPMDTGAKWRTALNFPYSMRWLMAGWNTLFLNKTRFSPKPGEDPQIARGRYLVDVQGHCSSCHTPRNFFMATTAAGHLSGADLGGWRVPNITSDKISGIGGWSRQEIVTYLRTGHVAGKAQAAGGMAEAVENGLRYLSEDDLQAMARYLQSLPAKRDTGQDRPSYSYGTPVAVDYNPADARGRALAQLVADARPAPKIAMAQRGQPSRVTSGALLYDSACASCHQPNGAGTSDSYYPSLFHNSAVGGMSPNNLVMAILEGVDRAGADGHAHMPAFAADMNDTQVAAVANYVAQTFGNPALHILPSQVAILRAGGPPSALQKTMPWIIGILILAALALLVVGLRPIWRRRA